MKIVYKCLTICHRLPQMKTPWLAPGSSENRLHGNPAGSKFVFMQSVQTAKPDARGPQIWPMSAATNSTQKSLYSCAVAVGTALATVTAEEKQIPKTFADFDKSAVAGSKVPTGLSEPLRAMWHAKAGEWTPAHEIAQEIKTPTGSWIHAFLHREEGDNSNANYWYRRAGKVMPTSLTIAEEWSFIGRELWQKEHGIAPGEEALTSTTGLVAASTKSADESEGAWDTVIFENGKQILRVTNARPVSFSPAGDVLLLREAAADDACRHFLIKPTADAKIQPFGQRQRIGGPFVVGSEWTEDGKSLTLRSDPALDDSKPEVIQVAEHLTSTR